MNILSEKSKAGSGPVLTGGSEKAKKYADTINLSIGDPDIPTPQIILDKAYEDVCAGFTKYSPGQGYDELRLAICRFYQEEYGVELSREQVSVTTGGGYAMFLALSAVLNPGDEVIVFEPYFMPYVRQISLAGGVAVTVPTYEKEEYQIDFDRLERAITPKTKGIIINTPSNPSGAAYTTETLTRLGQLAQKADLVVFADDIYTEYCYETPFVPMMSLPHMAERTITINSFSKNYIMTGFRVANIIAPQYVLEAISPLNDTLVFSPPCYSQRAALHGIENRKSFQKEMVEVFRKRIDYAVKRIGQMKNIHVLPPKGAFYLFPNITATGLSSQEIADILFEQAHVLVTPGNAFGQAGEGYIRICATVETSVLKEVFDRLEKLPIFR